MKQLRRTSLFALCFCFAFSACREKERLTAESEHGRIRIEIIAKDIAVPSGMAFLPDGTLLVTDRPKGKLYRINTQTLTRTEIRDLPEVTSKGDGGLHDVLPHPEFERNNQVFISYSFQSESGFSLAVERATLQEDRLAGRQRLFTARPYYPVASFFGSRLALKNGFLFVTTGVAKLMQDSAQLLTNHLGKIMRIREDGTIPYDNPFVNTPGALPEIWCYGTRNSQGISFHPQTGALWEHEHGPKGGDEINIIEGGKNYGWPVISYGTEYDGTPVGAGITHKEGMEQPLYYYVPSIAPSGMEFYTGNVFPAWKGNLFIGGMVLTHLNRLVLEGNKVVHEERLLKEHQWRVRSVRQGLDGFLYVGVDGGMVLRLSPD